MHSLATLDLPATDRDTGSTLAVSDRRKPILESAYPAHCQRILVSLLDLVEARGWSQAEAAKRIKHGAHQKPITASTLSTLLKGTYNADPRAVCASIERLLNLENGRAQFADISFVQTRLFDTLKSLADVVVITKGIGYYHGPHLCGKSVNAQALAHLYQNATPVFLTMPYADSYGGFIKRLAAVRNVEFTGTLSDVRERILGSLAEQHLLIIDEAHQPNLNYSHSQAVRCFEFIREINDLCRTPILLVGHTEGHADLVDHPSFERLSLNLLSKNITPEILGADKALRDLSAVFQAFKFPEPGPAEVQFCKDIVAAHSVARLFDILRLAASRAEKRNERLAWSHLYDVQSAILRLN